MISPLIINKKSPKVIIVMGMVRKTKIGLRIILNKVRTRATGIAATKLSISAPGKSFALSQTETDKTMSKMIKSISNSFK